MSEFGAPLTLLPQRRTNWLAFAASFAVQALALTMLVKIGIVQPQKFVPAKPHYNLTTLLLTSTPTQRPAPLPPRHMLPPVEAPKVTARLVPPPVPRERVKPPEIAPPQIPRAELAKLTPPSPPRVAVVRTGAFSSTGSQAAPTVARPARQVQTGGFGDPNGVKGEGKAGAKVMIASLGSFDLPPGPGYGNGTGGARGVRGTVASVGFGNGIAIGNSDHNSPGSRGVVQQGGFSDARPVSELPRVERAALQTPVTTPVQVLAKPNPVYTDEARQLKIEGEVLLEVVFQANGDCRVLRVLRGLGHGLDEAAARAARQIRFRPATRSGQPVDSTASLHVVFQLAY